MTWSAQTAGGQSELQQVPSFSPRVAGELWKEAAAGYTEDRMGVTVLGGDKDTRRWAHVSTLGNTRFAGRTYRLSETPAFLSTPSLAEQPPGFVLNASYGPQGKAFLQTVARQVDANERFGC